MKSGNFFAELKRRNVIRAAGLYLVGAWLLIQVASTVFPAFDVPGWALRGLILTLVIGFIPALIFSWVFELTPEGLKRDEDITPEQSIAPKVARRMNRMIIAALVLAVAYFCVDKFVLTPRRDAALLAADSKVQSPAKIDGTAPALNSKSIAVLPFESLSDDKGNAYFAEGIQDEILTRLAKVADLKVISRTSTQHFKSSPENLPEIAKQLGVANILEGSVQKAADQVRVNVQLIKAATDTHLWADTFDRKLIDIFAVESEIAKTIADTLQVKLTGAEKIQLAKKPTESSEAYELYLKGRFFWNKRTAADLKKSIEYFDQAIAKDPNYALAYAGLAQAWLLLPAYEGGAPKDCVGPGEAAARKALALDETSSDAHAALGLVLSLYQLDINGAATEFERAIQLNPNDATAQHWYASNLGSLAQFHGEVEGMRRALELDPLSLVINTNLGLALIHAGRLDEAIAQLRKTIEMDAGFSYARRTLGIALELKGKPSEAMAEYQKALALSDDPIGLGLLGHLYGKMGRTDDATRVLEQLKAMSEHRYVHAYSLAIVYLGLGDHSRALALLSQAYDDRDGDAISYIRTDPFLDPLRGDPKFAALAEKIVPASELGKVASPAK
jgi:TolB-like protein/Tfp pilus assembly protein PilF